jgi:hypothetical protein
MKQWGVVAITLAIFSVPTLLALLFYTTAPVSPETPQIVLPTHLEETVDDPTGEIVLDLQLWADQLRAHRESGEEGPAPLTITPLTRRDLGRRDCSVTVPARSGGAVRRAQPPVRPVRESRRLPCRMMTWLGWRHCLGNFIEECVDELRKDTLHVTGESIEEDLRGALRDLIVREICR